MKSAFQGTILSFAIVFVLCGCAAQGLSASNSKEHAAFSRAKSRIEVECGKFKGEDNRKLAFQAYNCNANILREEVLPNAVYPDLVLRYLEKVAKVTEQYRDGKISREKSNFKIQQLGTALDRERAERLNRDYQQAQMSDRQKGQAFSAGFNSSFAAPQPQTYYQQTQPRNVTCAPAHPMHPDWGVNCSSW